MKRGAQGREKRRVLISLSGNISNLTVPKEAHRSEVRFYSIVSVVSEIDQSLIFYKNIINYIINTHPGESTVMDSSTFC